MPFRFISLLTIALFAVACDELHVDVQLRLIRTGMTEQEVARILGPPWWTAQLYEHDGYTVSIMNGTVSFIESKGPPRIVVQYFKEGKEFVYLDGKKYPSDGPAAQVRFGWPLQSAMKPSQVEAIMGAPVSDCRDYNGDARASLHICFTNGRVVSKALHDQPPT